MRTLASLVLALAAGLTAVASPAADTAADVLAGQLAGLRRDPRLDGIAAAAARAASRGHVVATASLRDATVAGLGSELLPYVLTASGDDAGVQLAAALAELRAAVAVDAIGLAEARGPTGHVTALVATSPPTVTVARVRDGQRVSLRLAWPWPAEPRAYLATAGRARQVPATRTGDDVEVVIVCSAVAPGAGLELDAGHRLVASVPAVCGGRPAADSPVDVGPPARTTVELEQRLFALVNQARAEHGLPALAWDAVAHRMARAHAADMARAGVIGHVGSGGATLDARVRAHALPAAETFENVGRAGGPGEAHAAFLASPRHRANLLAAGALRGAIGVAVDPRAPGDHYVVQLLFEPR